MRSPTSTSPNGSNQVLHQLQIFFRGTKYSGFRTAQSGKEQDLSHEMGISSGRPGLTTIDASHAV